MTPEEFATALQAEGYSPATPIERPAGYSLGDHQHPFDACALITAGEITLTVDGQSRTYAAGDIFRLPAGTEHLEHAGPEGVAYLSCRRQVLA
jgi:quercetin dioxygenase-like cupin family protein